MKILFFILLISLLTACSENNSDVAATNAEATAVKPNSVAASQQVDSSVGQSLALQVFEVIPDSIGGCGDYYAVDTSEKAEVGTYVFLSNISEFAIIRVAGKTISLTRNEALSKEIAPDHFISVFEGNGYTVTLEAKIAERYDEGGFYRGKLQIERGTEKITLNVHGETGC